MGDRSTILLLLLASTLAANSSPPPLPAYFLRSTLHRLGDFDYALENGSMSARFRDREAVYHLGAHTVRIHYHAARPTHPEGLEALPGRITFLTAFGPTEPAAQAYRSSPIARSGPASTPFTPSPPATSKLNFRSLPWPTPH